MLGKFFLKTALFILIFLFISLGGAIYSVPSGESRGELPNSPHITDSILAENSPEGYEIQEMLQYVSRGHVLGFRRGDAFFATADHALRVEFLNAQEVSPQEVGTAPIQIDQQTFQLLDKIVYSDLWDGVTLVYEKHNSGVVKSTYYIEPNAKGKSDPVEQICLRYNASVEIDRSGNLVFPFETGIMKESRPVAWQKIKGTRVPVEVSYRLIGEDQVGFELGSYNLKFPLTIDPVLTWFTFIGGASNDSGNRMTVDAAGNVYVVGRCDGTWGVPVDAHPGPGAAFVAKLNTNGALVWHTYMGAAAGNVTWAADVAVDASGNVYVGGTTNSTSSTWPGWPAAPVSTFASPRAFAAKLNSNGARQWYTFMGTAASDEGHCIAVDSQQNVYVGGYSFWTWGATQINTFGNAFISKLTSSGVYQWSTFYQDRCRDLAVDASDNIYATGESNNTWGTPIVAHAANTFADAWAAKVNPSGTLIWNTFMGALPLDYGRAIALDSSGNVFVVGYSTGTWGTPIVAHSGGEDGFAVKFDNNGTRLWSTFLGGAGDERSNGIDLDLNGNVYVGGHGDNWGAPLAGFPNNGNKDVYFAKLSGNGSYMWHGFVGSTVLDDCTSLKLDPSGNIYMAGTSGNISWGVVPLVGHSGSDDAYALKIGNGAASVTTTAPSNVTTTSASSGGNVTSDGGNAVTARGVCWGTSTNPTTADSKTSDGTGTGAFASSLAGLTPGTTYYVRAYATNDFGTAYGNEVSFTTGAGTRNLTIAADSGGTTSPTPGTHSQANNSTVNVTAASDAGCRFDRWTGDVPAGNENQNPLTLTMDSDKSVTAHFKKIYFLSLAAETGGSTDPVPGVYTYDEGAREGITATPNVGYVFDRWTGDVPPGDAVRNPLPLIMDQDRTITAHFKKRYTLKTSAGTGGSVTPAPGTYSYNAGTQVSLSAIPQNGYMFSGWTGDVPAGQENANPLSVTMNQNRSIKAHFVLQRTLIITAGANGTTSPVPGTYTYQDGETVTILAVPEAHCECGGWSGDITSVSETITVTMDKDKSVNVTFRRIIYGCPGLTGEKVLNRSLTQSEYINIIKWQANSNNINIQSYRIYDTSSGGRTLLNTVAAGTFQFLHRNVDGNKSYSYELVAVNNEGREGASTFVTVR
ncbi:SBBP repeat-containing protein [Acidobacteriota bacterium]